MTVGIPGSRKTPGTKRLKKTSSKPDQSDQPDQPDQPNQPVRSTSSISISSSGSYIIPRIREYDRREEDDAVETVAEVRVETEGDKNHRYFVDQLVHKRPKWNKSWFATVAMTAFAVDIYSVSAFPEQVAENGGLAFLIAYLIVTFGVVLPYLYLEGIMGQYFQISFIGIWGICPLFKGISVGVLMTTFLVATVFSTFITWAFAMVVGIAQAVKQKEFEWDHCDHGWSSCQCHPPPRHIECLGSNPNLTRRSSEVEYFIGSIIKLWKTKSNDPIIIKDVTQNGNVSTTFGFHSEQGLGEFNSELAGCLAIICICLLVVVWASHRTAGLIYTFSAFFPLVVLTLMICRGLTFGGGWSGLLKYFSPDFTKWLGVQFWLTAAQTAFFSIGTGFGMHLTTASYNPIHNDVFRNAVGCVFIDVLTNLMGCVVNFSFLGHRYWREKIDPIPDRYEAGEMTELFPFTIFLETLSDLTAISVFATLYYLMIIVITLDTISVTLQTIVHSVHEEYIRKYPDQNVSDHIFLFGLVGLNFMVALVFMTRGGIWPAMFAMHYGVDLNFCVFPALQSIAFIWIWGLENVCNAVTTIYGKRPCLYLRICWKFVCPTVLCVFAGFYAVLISWTPLTMFGITAPESSIPAAIVVTYFCVVGFLIYTFIEMIKGIKRATGFLTYIMLLISPEYEHKEIKQNVWNAKRLHWKHYSFLLFPDEKFKEMAFSEFGHIFRKKQNRVQDVEAEGHDQHHSEHEHHHHHRVEHTPVRQSETAWSLFEHDMAATSKKTKRAKSDVKIAQH